MNWKLFDSETPVMIQGITGKEGARMARWLIASGINVVGGVTPGKGGQVVEGRPVWNTVAEARAAYPDLVVSSIVVPAPRALGAVEEAIAAGVTHLHILTEGIPVHDVLTMRQCASASGAVILGPSSVGYLQFPKFRIGYLGGETPFKTLSEGGVAVLSTSGGMANELLMALAREGIGIRIGMALGGDRIVGTTFEAAVRMCEELPSVTSLAIFVEPGRSLLRSLVSGTFVFRKPVVIFLAGEAIDDLPRGIPYGHTGTILGEDDPPVREIRRGLVERGISCVGAMSEFLTVMKRYG